MPELDRYIVRKTSYQGLPAWEILDRYTQRRQDHADIFALRRHAQTHAQLMNADDRKRWARREAAATRARID